MKYDITVELYTGKQCAKLSVML